MRTIKLKTKDGESIPDNTEITTIYTVAENKTITKVFTIDSNQSISVPESAWRVLMLFSNGHYINKYQTKDSGWQKIEPGESEITIILEPVDQEQAKKIFNQDGGGQNRNALFHKSSANADSLSDGTPPELN